MPRAFMLPEHVDFENLMAVRATGEEYIDQNDEPVFDLSALATSSSAVVALLVGWFRYAHTHGKVVSFTKVPTGVMNIIEVSDLTDLLPIEASA
ncbi:MAG: STAS domain-containing protein [Pseudomonadales bacterium]|jgi:ABC-type transporter Mla MlaB component